MLWIKQSRAYRSTWLGCCDVERKYGKTSTQQFSCKLLYGIVYPGTKYWDLQVYVIASNVLQTQKRNRFSWFGIYNMRTLQMVHNLKTTARLTWLWYSARISLRLCTEKGANLCRMWCLMGVILKAMPVDILIVQMYIPTSTHKVKQICHEIEDMLNREERG